VNILFPIPIAIFAVLALLFLFFSRQARGLKSVLVASYCGVIIITFTGGASGAIWLAPLFLFLIGLVVIRPPTMPVFNSKMMTRFTYGMFCLFIIGTFVGLLRYDPSLEFIKAGRFLTLFGISIQYLMALYRFHTVIFLFLAFALPLRYYVNREVFLKCLTLCWIFTVILSISSILDYFGVANLAFTYRREAGFGRVAVLGFHRGSIGMMITMGIFMSFAMTQLTRRYSLKMVGYCSLPILIIALLFTFSRGAMLALVVGVISLAITLGGARGLKGVIIVLIVGIVVHTVLSQIPELRERFGFLLTGKFAARVGLGRLTAWKNLIKWLFRSPGILAVGAGFQNFHYFVNLLKEQVTLEAAHNNYLHILVELGILGFLVFIGWLVSIFTWLNSWRRTMMDKVDRMMPGIFISLMLAITVSCLTQESLSPSPAMVPWLVHFFIILGIWVSYYRTQMNEIYYKPEYYDYDQYESQQYEYIDS